MLHGCIEGLGLEAILRPTSSKVTIVSESAFLKDNSDTLFEYMVKARGLDIVYEQNPLNYVFDAYFSVKTG